MNGRGRRVQSLKLGSAAQLFPIVVGYGTQLVVTPYVVARLGLHDFGIWSITGALAQYAGLLDLGVSRSASRYVAYFHEKGDKKGEGVVVGICLSTLLVLGLLLAVFSYSLASSADRLFGTQDVTLASILLLCSAAIVVIGLAARVLAAASVGRGRHISASVGVAVLSTLQALGGVVTLVNSPSLDSYAIGTVVGTGIGFVVVIGLIMADERRINVAWPQRGMAREVLAFGAKSQLAAAGDLLLMQSGKIVAGIMVGPAAAGIYELASRLAAGAQVFGAASTAALTPHLTRVYISRSLDGVRSEYEHLTRRNATVSLFVPTVMAATAWSAIPLWLGHQDDEVAVILVALLIGVIVNVSTGVGTSTVMAIGKPALVAQATIVGGFFQAAFAIAMCYGFGLHGIVVAFALGVPFAKLAAIFYLQLKIKFSSMMYIRGVSGPYLVALIASLAAAPISVLANPTSRGEALIPFACSIAVFAAVYFLLSWRQGYLPSLRSRSSARVDD